MPGRIIFGLLFGGVTPGCEAHRTMAIGHGRGPPARGIGAGGPGRCEWTERPKASPMRKRVAVSLATPIRTSGDPAPATGASIPARASACAARAASWSCSVEHSRWPARCPAISTVTHGPEADGRPPIRTISAASGSAGGGAVCASAVPPSATMAIAARIADRPPTDDDKVARPAGSRPDGPVPAGVGRKMRNEAARATWRPRDPAPSKDSRQKRDATVVDLRIWSSGRRTGDRPRAAARKPDRKTASARPDSCCGRPHNWRRRTSL